MLLAWNIKTFPKVIQNTNYTNMITFWDLIFFAHWGCFRSNLTGINLNVFYIHQDQIKERVGYFETETVQALLAYSKGTGWPQYQNRQCSPCICPDSCRDTCWSLRRPRETLKQWNSNRTGLIVCVVEGNKSHPEVRWCLNIDTRSAPANSTQPLFIAQYLL